MDEPDTPLAIRVPPPPGSVSINHLISDLRQSQELKAYGKFSLRLIGPVMFGATFNLVTSVGVP